MSGSRRPAGFATRAIHEGQAPEPHTGAVIVPIYQTATFAQDDINVHKGYDYSRAGNPTRAALEQCLASLESGSWALAFGSGMAAIAACMHLFKSGDHTVVMNDVYGGTFRLFRQVLEQYGLRFTFVDASRTANVQRALTPKTRLVWLESPTNPLLKLADLAAIARLAHTHGALVAVDNTFLSPFFQRPLELGADLVVHSTTKYLGGHSDVIGGAVAGSSAALGERLRFIQKSVGGVPGPLDAWLVLRGLKTLAVRMREHERNALQVAEFLSRHKAVAAVHYPGLKTHPQHGLARRQQSGFGGMLSFEVKGGYEAARRVVTQTRVFTLAESLGGVESLIEHPERMTHASLPAEVRAELGVGPGLVRLSCGIEDGADLVDDLDQALGSRRVTRKQGRRSSGDSP